MTWFAELYLHIITSALGFIDLILLANLFFDWYKSNSREPKDPKSKSKHKKDEKEKKK